MAEFYFIVKEKQFVQIKDKTVRIKIIMKNKK